MYKNTKHRTRGHRVKELLSTRKRRMSVEVVECGWKSTHSSVQAAMRAIASDLHTVGVVARCLAGEFVLVEVLLGVANVLDVLVDASCKNECKTPRHQ